MSMSLPELPCVARIELDGHEVRWLDSLPGAADEVPTSVRCSLEFDHPGPHAALGQAVGDTELWVRWTLRASEIVRLPNCPEHDTTPSQEPCFLFDKHPGKHTFERAFPE